MCSNVTQIGRVDKYVVFLFNGLLSQDDVLYTEFGVVLEHVQLIRLYERELLALDEQRRIHEQRFSPALSSIRRREGFELLVIPWGWVRDRQDVYDRFGPVRNIWPIVGSGSLLPYPGRSSPPTARSSESVGSGGGGKRIRSGRGCGCPGPVEVPWECYITNVFSEYKYGNTDPFTSYSILRYQVIPRRVFCYVIAPVEFSLDKNDINVY